MLLFQLLFLGVIGLLFFHLLMFLVLLLLNFLSFLFLLRHQLVQLLLVFLVQFGVARGRGRGRSVLGRSFGWMAGLTRAALLSGRVAPSPVCV